MKEIIIPDTAIIAVNRGKQENMSDSIVYRDNKDQLHSIDFDVCAANFKAEHESSSGKCIGERKIDEYYFVFYTSGIKTKIIFRAIYVFNLTHCHLLAGSRISRFRALQKLINETKYTTYDLS